MKCNHHGVTQASIFIMWKVLIILNSVTMKYWYRFIKKRIMILEYSMLLINHRHRKILDVWKQNSNCLLGDFGNIFAMKNRIGIAGQLQISRESVGFVRYIYDHKAAYECWETGQLQLGDWTVTSQLQIVLGWSARTGMSLQWLCGHWSSDYVAFTIKT